jgi:hypothetical protein
VAESCTICSSCSRRPVRKLLDTPLYFQRIAFWRKRNSDKFFWLLSPQNIRGGYIIFTLAPLIQFHDCLRVQVINASALFSAIDLTDQNDIRFTVTRCHELHAECLLIWTNLVKFPGWSLWVPLPSSFKKYFLLDTTTFLSCEQNTRESHKTKPVIAYLKSDINSTKTVGYEQYAPSLFCTQLVRIVFWVAIIL